MVDRRLLYKEFKQHQWIYLSTALIIIFFLPFLIYNDYSSYQQCVKHNGSDCEFSISLNDLKNSLIFPMYCLISIGMTFYQLGLERTKGTLDFTLSLPFKRGQIFNTKFMLGASVLVLSHIVTFLLSSLLILLLHPKDEGFTHFMIGITIINLMAYTLFMAAGTLTGNSFAQGLVGFTTLILPYLIVALPLMHLDIWFDHNASNLVELTIRKQEWLSFLIPVVYINTEIWIDKSYFILLIPIAMSIVFYLIGYFSFIKYPNERNGNFFLWKGLNRPIQILVIIFGILGFSFFGYTTAERSIIGYIIGMVIGGTIGFLISYFFIYKKTKIF